MFQAVCYHLLSDKSAANGKRALECYYEGLTDEINRGNNPGWIGENLVKNSAPLIFDCTSEGFPKECNELDVLQKLREYLNKIQQSPESYN